MSGEERLSNEGVQLIVDIYERKIKQFEVEKKARISIIKQLKKENRELKEKLKERPYLWIKDDSFDRRPG